MIEENISFDRPIVVDIIVCYNNNDLYSDMQRSIQERGGSGVKWNIIGIDNTENSFKSAAEAYNYALKKSNGDCVVFCHQDILFLEGSLATIAQKCLSFPKTLWGAAGGKKLEKLYPICIV